MRNAQDSSLLGTYQIPRPVQAGTSATFSVTNVMETLGYPPNAKDFHINMTLDTTFSGSVRHYVYSEVPGTLVRSSVLRMVTSWSIEAPISTRPPGAVPSTHACSVVLQGGAPG